MQSMLLTGLLKQVGLTPTPTHQDRYIISIHKGSNAKQLYYGSKQILTYTYAYFSSYA